MIQMTLQAPVPNGPLSVNDSHSHGTHSVGSFGTTGVIVKISQMPDGKVDRHSKDGKCQVCKQNFSEAATLQQHMRRHTQESKLIT